MENASKALLIAAGVLIIILLIAFGMKIFNSAGDTSKDAQEVGSTITSQNKNAKISAILSMMNYKDDKVFNSYIISNYGGSRSGSEIKELCQLVSQRDKMITGKEKSDQETYISTWQDDGKSELIWEGSLQKTLNKIDDNKKYTVKFEKKEVTDGEVYRVNIFF